MADTLLGAIYERLAGTVAVTSKLSTYAGAPAIFSGEVPEDASGTWMIIEAPLDESRPDTKTTRLIDVTRDISMFTPAGGSALPLERLAYVHVAGGVECEGVWHDTHTHPVTAPVLDLLATLASRAPLPGVRAQAGVPQQLAGQREVGTCKLRAEKIEIIDK